MNSYALLAFVLLLAAAHLVTRPFLLPDRETPDEDPETPALAVEKDRLIEAIRDLDLDFATGKLEEADYRRLRARDTAAAARILQALAEQADEEIERRIAARRAALLGGEQRA